MSLTIHVDDEGNPCGPEGCCVKQLDAHTLQRVLDCARKGYIEAALCITARALCHDDERLLDVTITNEQHECIVEALLSNGHQLAAVNAMLTWLDRGPAHQGETR